MATPEDKYTLDDLETLSGLPGRTIRSWISAGIVPKPRGRGRGAHFGEGHLVRLRFAQRVREQVGSRVSLRVLAEVARGVDSGTIERVACGEEPVRALPLSGLEPLLQGKVSYRLAEAVPERKDVSRGSRARVKRGEFEHWTTIAITEDLELRLRDDDPDRIADLARLARRLRSWLAEAPI